MHGDRLSHFHHITLRKRLLIIFLFCAGIFTMFFFRTVEVVQHRIENFNVRLLYEDCQAKLAALQVTAQTSVYDSHYLKRYYDNNKKLPITIQGQMDKMNGSKAARGFENIKPLPPNHFIFPHLEKGSEGLLPAYHMNSFRQGVDIVIGVNTVKRDKADYLFRTLKDLMSGITTDATSVLVIIMIGETDLRYVLETAWKIEKEFPIEIGNGVFQIISPSPFYYPNLKAIPATLGDSRSRTMWRAKQVLDRVYLMAYGLTKGTYYLMVEDDIVARKMYMKGVKSYISYCTQNKPEWLVIEFSHYFGSLGKLFRASDVGHFIIYLQLFYYNMPLDFLIENYLEDRACGRVKSSEKCFNAVNRIRIKHPISLFLHVGLYSSLTGKLSKVEEASAAVGITFFPHKNPPLKKVVCDIRELPFHTAEMAYNGEYIFLGVYPEIGDVIEFWFEKPTALKSYLFQTGNYQNTKDLLKNADVEVLPHGGLRYNFTKVGSFDEFGCAKGNLETMGLLEAIRLRVMDYGPLDSGKVVISEIELVPLNEKSLM